MPVGECAMLRDRPALRLDSRLVCKYEILSVIGKGSFSQVIAFEHGLAGSCTSHCFAGNAGAASDIPEVFRGEAGVVRLRLSEQ